MMMAEDTTGGDVENPAEEAKETTPTPSPVKEAGTRDASTKWKAIALCAFIVVIVALAIGLGTTLGKSETSAATDGGGGVDAVDGETTTSTTIASTESQDCLVGDIMYRPGDSIGHIGYECVNSTSYDGTESYCDPEGSGEIVTVEKQFTCPESVPYCVQCGPRKMGAALCLSEPTTDRDCGDEGATTETPVEPQVYKARYLEQNGPIQAQVRILDPSVADGYESCDDFRDDIENALKHYANSIIVREKQNNWYEQCDPQNPNGWYGIPEVALEGDVAFAAPAADFDAQESVADDSATSSFSGGASAAKVEEDSFGTNNQVEGVDEADIAKSDGVYVYAAYGDLLYVWNATDGTQGISVTKMPFDDTPNEECEEFYPKPGPIPEPWLVKEDVAVSFEENVGTVSVTNEGIESSTSESLSAVAEPAQSISKSSPGGIRGRRDLRDRRRKTLSIAPGWNPCSKSKPRILSLLLDGSRLTAVVSESNYRWRPWNYYEEDDAEPQPIINDDTKLTLRVYDIAEVPTGGGSLTLLSERELKGNYDSARSVGSTGFVITTSYVDKSSFDKDLYRHRPQYCGLSASEYENTAVETALKNTQPFIDRMIEEMQLQLDGTCRGIFRVAAMQSGDSAEDSTGGDMLGQFVQVSSFDMSSNFEVLTEIPTSVGAAFSSGWLNSVYASQNFAATLNVGSSYNANTGEWDQSTFVLGFNMMGAEPEPFCSAEIAGQPLNQYSTDLYDGHLRVVTTEWDWSNAESRTSNKIFILKVPEVGKGKEMKLVGESDHLGKPNESVFSVRFIREMAYIVTFERTDPFYIFNLTDPTTPQKMGELEIPGFSSYLHPLELDGVDFILGVGEHVDETSGQREGVKISLFDISNPREPTESATFVDKGAYSSAGHDFKSFRYLPITRKLILPKSEYTWSENDNFDGFVVYDVSADEITPSYEIQHASSYSMYHGCWYGAYMPARSFVFKSKLTTILSHSVVSTDLENGDELWNVTLGENMTGKDCSPYFVAW